ncbi:MAG TPA: hypothetical protein VHL78_02900 [Actinomycetota bacterium]|nr:hypothetical protein [Actinomycetota bacterium]
MGWTFLALAAVAAVGGAMAVADPGGAVARLDWVRVYRPAGVFALAASFAGLGAAALALPRGPGSRGRVLLARAGWGVIVGGLAFLLFVPASCSIGIADGGISPVDYQGTRCVTLSGATFTSDDFPHWGGLYGVAMPIAVALATFGLLSVFRIPAGDQASRPSAAAPAGDPSG